MSNPVICVSCKSPLIPPDAPFCGKCGSSQTRPQLCVHCRAQLPPDAAFCIKCGKSQSHPQQQDSFVKHCIHCKAQLPLDAAFCMKCSKSQMPESLFVPCILCRTTLRPSAQNCLFCSAPQDPEEFKKQPLKDCHQCGTRLLLGAKICHNKSCYAHQLLIPPSPTVTIDLTKEPINDPHATSTAPEKHPTDGSSGGLPSQVPHGPPPDTSLQPVDPPILTKEELAEKFKPPQPSTSTPAPNEDNAMDTSNVTPSPLKRSSDESADNTKRAKTTNEAAVASGAVVQQRISDYDIEGEGNGSDRGADSVADQLTGNETRKRKKSDNDGSPLSKKVEVTDDKVEGRNQTPAENVQNDGKQHADEKKENEFQQEQAQDKNKTSSQNPEVIADQSDLSQSGNLGETEKSFVAGASDSESSECGTPRPSGPSGSSSSPSLAIPSPATPSPATPSPASPSLTKPSPTASTAVPSPHAPDPSTPSSSASLSKDSPTNNIGKVSDHAPQSTRDNGDPTHAMSQDHSSSHDTSVIDPLQATSDNPNPSQQEGAAASYSSKVKSEGEKAKKSDKGKKGGKGQENGKGDGIGGGRPEKPVDEKRADSSKNEQIGPNT